MKPGFGFDRAARAKLHIEQQARSTSLHIGRPVALVLVITDGRAM